MCSGVVRRQVSEEAPERTAKCKEGKQNNVFQRTQGNKEMTCYSIPDIPKSDRFTMETNVPCPACQDRRRQCAGSCTIIQSRA